MGNSGLFIRWVRVTWVGWLIGIPLIIVLALAGEAVGIGGSQTIVGAGMGAGIGWMQGRVVRGILHQFAPWILSCVVGLGVPFLLTDLAKFAGWSTPYSLQWCVVFGGLIVSVWQAGILRSHFRKTGWWAAASACGWLLAAGTAAASDVLFRSRSLQGLWGAFVFLGIIAVGGLILGLPTGAALVRLPRRESAD